MIDIALSGGGVRAMAFHAGILQFLAERGQLERVRHLSTVSGGSLVVGLVFHSAGVRWPSSVQYLETVLPALRATLTTHDLQLSALAQLILRPWNWRFSLSRANVFAQAIATTWGISASLSNLPQAPIWSINGTTAETGVRFRFKASDFGDYQLGYADAQNFELAQALAVSAAFPGAIGPFALESSRYTWRKRPSWNSQEVAQVVKVRFKRLHIYDGGLYDNLGLEPLFDAGTQTAKAPGALIIVSDAGSPLSRRAIGSPLSPRRMKRWLDLATEQQRALRVRGFMNALMRGTVSGAYLQIGAAPIEQLERLIGIGAAGDREWLTAQQTSAAAAVLTSLGRLAPATFDLLRRHGYETALWNHMARPYIDVIHDDPARGD